TGKGELPDAVRSGPKGRDGLWRRDGAGWPRQTLDLLHRTRWEDSVHREDGERPDRRRRSGEEARRAEREEEVGIRHQARQKLLDPIARYKEWFAEAAVRGHQDPKAAFLATADAEGQPSSRVVL